MTKTLANIAARQAVKSGEPGKMPLCEMADGTFVWIFEFGSLGFVWDLVFGAWNFQDCWLAGNFRKISYLSP